MGVRIRQLPNLISGLRIALVPVWVFVAEACRSAESSAEQEALRMTTLGILVTIGVSDVVDGWIARHFGLISNLGAALDAIADKLAQITLLTFFVWRGPPAFAPLPLWFWLVVMGRDVVLATGWLIMYLSGKKLNVVHHWHGKAASLLLFALIVYWNASPSAPGSEFVLPVLALWITLSTAFYARDGWVQYRPRQD